jgi:hypothetical protein
MAGPENYGGDVTRFFLTELYRARVRGQLLDIMRTGGAARLEYFREQDLTTGVTSLFGCTSIIIISKGAVWVSHWWEGPFFLIANFDQFRDGVLTPLINGAGSENGDDGMPGLGGLTGPTQPFEPLYEPRAFIMSPRVRDGYDTFEYAGKIRMIELMLQSLFPHIQITTYMYSRNKVGAKSDRSPLGKILIQYSATEPGCKRKYRIWVEAQELFEESWPAAEGLPNISSRDVNTCGSSSTTASSDYSTSRSSSTITSSDYSTSRGSSTITSSGYSTSFYTSTSTSSSPVEVETMSSSQTISNTIPAGATPCPSSGDFNFLPCPDGEDQSIAVMEENPVASGDAFAYNLYSACNNAPVTVILNWPNGTALIKTLGLVVNEFDTPGNLEPCLFWTVATAVVT